MSLFLRDPPLHHSQIFHPIQHIKFLNDEIITTKDGGTRRYLARWKGKLPIDDTWVNRSKLQQIDSDILEQYESLQLLTRQSRVLSNPEKMMWTSS